MAFILSNVKISKNPVTVREVFKIEIEVVEIPEEYNVYCGTFVAGQAIVFTAEPPHKVILYAGAIVSGQTIYV